MDPPLPGLAVERDQTASCPISRSSLPAAVCAAEAGPVVLAAAPAPAPDEGAAAVAVAAAIARGVCVLLMVVVVVSWG